MPWGYECRAKLIKQFPAKPVERRGLSDEPSAPGPNQYDPPQIFCGNGYSKIKRAPAYTFGHRTPLSLLKPAATANARLFNVQGMGRKGVYRICHSVVTPHIEPPHDRTKIPGPAAHAPRHEIRYKRPAAYSLTPPAHPLYEAWDQWTPPPNMYKPPFPCKREPAYSLGYMVRRLKEQDLPGPGEHDPNFDYVRKTKPAFSIGAPFKPIKAPKTPPPNIYCEKKFMVSKPTIPAPSFGIRHSPYLGKQKEYLKSSKLDLLTSTER